MNNLKLKFFYYLKKSHKIILAIHIYIYIYKILIYNYLDNSGTKNILKLKKSRINSKLSFNTKSNKLNCLKTHI